MDLVEESLITDSLIVKVTILNREFATFSIPIIVKDFDMLTFVKSEYPVIVSVSLVTSLSEAAPAITFFFNCDVLRFAGPITLMDSAIIFDAVSGPVMEISFALTAFRFAAPSIVS
jgi:hypothetical protein